MDIKNIVEKYHLTKTEENILEYLSKKDSRNLRIRILAEEMHVSTALIINMAKKMGHTGYTDMIYFMNQSQDVFEKLQQHQIIDNHGELFLNIIRKYKDKQIVVVGIGYSNNIANYISDFFNLFGFRSTSNFHHQFLRESYSEELLIIFVSNSGNTKELIEYAEEATSSGIEYLLFTGNPLSKMEEMSALVICTESYSVFRYTEYKPQLFFGTILNYFELLMAHVLKNL